METQEYIKQFLERVGRKGMEREDIVFLIVQVRHLIEGKHDISDYRTTELYCNWMVHTDLYTSDGGLIIIRDLTKALVENWNPTKGTAGQEISNVFGLSSLRRELIKLFDNHSLPTVIFSEYENWKNIVGLLIYYLRGKPIHFPNKEVIQKERLASLINEIESIIKPADFFIKNVSIIGDQSPHWCIELGGEKDTTKIVGELFLQKDELPKILEPTVGS